MNGSLRTQASPGSRVTLVAAGLALVLGGCAAPSRPGSSSADVEIAAVPLPPVATLRPLVNDSPAAALPSPGPRPRIALAEGAGRAPALDGPVSRALRSAGTRNEVRNVMQIGDSNFSDLFAAYRTVGERVMVFPNDSMRMGDYNKAVVLAEMERFRPDTDVFSVVGCSLGPTRLENGNEVLALGRASRVVEELVRAGVPVDRVVDEGCWAGEASERFPGRGVVLTLKRRQGAS